MLTSSIRVALYVVIAVCFAQVDAVPSWGQQPVHSELYKTLWTEIVDAQLSELPQIETRLARLGDRDLSDVERLRLHEKLAYRYRNTNPKAAVNAAKRVIGDPIFDANEIDPEAASSWAGAAESLFLAAGPIERSAFVKSTQKEFVESKQSVCFRLFQLNMLLRSHARLGTPEEGRRLAEEHLPEILQSIPVNPAWLTLRSLWKLDLLLARVRVPGLLRLRSLDVGLKAVERVMKQSDGFHHQQFSNLWHFRLITARILSERGANDSAILALLDGMDEYRDLSMKAIRFEVEDSEPAITRIAEFHQSNIDKIKALAAKGRIPQRNDLVGKQAPNFELTTLDGQTVSSGNLRGRIIVIDFWAVWCGPCIAAFPDLKELDEKFDDDSVLLVGVTKRHGYRWNEADNRIQEYSNAGRDEEIAAIQRFVASHDLQFPQVLDEGEMVDLFSVKRWPTTVLIDQEGIVRFSGSTFKKTQFEHLVDTIESLVKK